MRPDPAGKNLRHNRHNTVQIRESLAHIDLIGSSSAIAGNRLRSSRIFAAWGAVSWACCSRTWSPIHATSSTVEVAMRKSIIVGPWPTKPGEPVAGQQIFPSLRQHALMQSQCRPTAQRLGNMAVCLDGRREERP